MNDFLQNISYILKVCLSANILTFLVDYLFLEEFVIFLKYAVYCVTFISVCVNLYFKWKHAKMEIEIKQLRKKDAENEANNRFIFNSKYSEEDELK